jgi:hypothetical protein
MPLDAPSSQTRLPCQSDIFGFILKTAFNTENTEKNTEKTEDQSTNATHPVGAAIFFLRALCCSVFSVSKVLATEFF